MQRSARWYCVFLFAVFSGHVSGHLPYDLTNYVNFYPCSTSTRLVLPWSIEDVKEAVLLHDKLMAVGVGHSYGDPFFCAEPTVSEGKTSANIVMTTIRPLLISVDEDDGTAWISAGVTLWDIADYLGNYVTEKAPRGYALGALPYLLNQTIGGAIATSTHGQNVQYGSLSNQMAGLRVVLANGTVADVYPETHPFLFKALQVNVGRLGVVTDVKMRIIPETPTRRTLQSDVPARDILAEFEEAQEMYKGTGQLSSRFKQDRFLQLNPVAMTFQVITVEPLPDTHVPSERELHAKIQESKPYLEAVLDRINAPLSLERQRGLDSCVAEGVEWEMPKPFPTDPEHIDLEALPAYLAGSEAVNIVFEGNFTGDTHEASPTYVYFGPWAEVVGLLDDYELVVGLKNGADCLGGLLHFLQTEVPDSGLRSAVIIRQIGKENGFLSYAHDGPVFFFNLQDYVYDNTKPHQSNVHLKKLLGYFLSDPACAPNRLHWGKSGFPDPGCYNGAERYGVNWCHFGCAARALDPEEKFAGQGADRWNWNGAHLDDCCTEDGYDTSKPECSCSVVPIRAREECPPPPFFTYR